jgi:hypothetical protein
MGDNDGDLPYRLTVISNNDSNNDSNNNGEGAHEDKNTGMGQQETNAVAADNSPISETGSWEIVNPGDGN